MRRVYEFLRVDAGFTPKNLDREFLLSNGRATYSPATWRLRRALKRRWPSSKRTKEFVDSILPRSILRIASLGEVHESHPVPDRLRSKLVDLLDDDVCRLRAYMDEGFDGWGIA